MTKILFKTFQLIVATILLTSCGSSSSTEPTATTSITKTDIKAVYDVPSLIGKNIDEIRKVLGKPSDKEIEPTKLQMKMKFDSWDNSFEKEGCTLLATFNPQNRRVADFFIETTDPSGSKSDYSDLLQICNVTNDNPKYSIEAVPTIKDNTKYTGIKIVAK
jgi:hypothetical protein